MGFGFDFENILSKAAETVDTASKGAADALSRKLFLAPPLPPERPLLTPQRQHPKLLAV